MTDGLVNHKITLSSPFHQAHRPNQGMAKFFEVSVTKFYDYYFLLQKCNKKSVTKNKVTIFLLQPGFGVEWGDCYLWYLLLGSISFG
jgi:hypothetical protein